MSLKTGSFVDYEMVAVIKSINLGFNIRKECGINVRINIGKSIWQ